MTVLSTDTASRIVDRIKEPWPPRYGSPEREALNKARIEDPQLGDFWHEMFQPYFVVVGIRRTVLGAKVVTVCQKTKSEDPNRWTWDLSKLDEISVAELRKQVTYSSMDKCVASCEPGAHIWAVDEAEALNSDDPKNAPENPGIDLQLTEKKL